jgi:hypothetical protein
MYKHIMLKKDLDTLRKEFWEKRDELTKHIEQFNWLSQKYPPERFEGSAARLYNSYSLFLRDLYDYVEELYKENIELRKEIEQLKR